ncbi:glycoside hydrolase family 18 protein [Ornithobacterium rhinotracheale]
MGRKGVVKFVGNSEGSNVGGDLLNRSDEGVDRFSFGTWLNLDEWTPGAKIFQKNSWDNEKASLFLGQMPGDFVFKLMDKEIKFKTDININQWKFIGIAYDGKGKVKFNAYVDGQQIRSINIPVDFPNELEFARGVTYLGRGLHGKLDNTFFSQIPLGKSQFDFFMKDMVNLKNAKWFMVKTLAYWRYNTAETYKRDEQSWRFMVDDIRKKIGESGKDIKVRLGVHNSRKDTWKRMLANSKNRENFAHVLKVAVQKDNWDGVDFDLEWCYGQTEIDNFSKGVVATGKKLKELDGKIFSISLHPFTGYQISKEAIDAIDFVSLQIYGPSGVNIMPWDVFEPSAEKFIKHGYPKEKMVLGVPFYGSVKPGVPVMAYSDFVKDGLSDPALDKYYFKNQNYIFNGVNTIRRKAEYIRDNGFGGVMSWDISLDVPFDDPLSLQKILNEVLGAPQ